MRKYLVGMVIGLAMTVSACGLGTAGIAALAGSLITGASAGVAYYVENMPSPSATPTPTVHPTMSATPAPSPVVAH